MINALTDREHPCQALADFLTLKEHLGSLKGKKIAWIGDGNNVAHSLMLLSGLLGVSMAVATPEGYSPQQSVIERAQALANSNSATITVGYVPHEAVEDADAIITDVWASMGQELEHATRLSRFAPFQVTPELMASSGKPDTIFMHCLPAHRGEEVVPSVIDGPRSVVFDEAENRLHAQKALMLHLLER